MIVGPAGSGKTTLARKLARDVNAPLVELDLIAYTNGRGPKISAETRQSSVASLAAEDTWVAEGSYAWPEPLFEAADSIIWLDLPWRVCAYRIVARHVRLSVAGKNRHPGVKRMLQFTWRIRSYWDSGSDPTLADWDNDHLKREAVALAVEPHHEKVARCRTSREAAHVLRRLDN